MEEKIKKKHGRKPLFNADEIDIIQKDVGTIDQLAAKYRTSRQTIARIRSNYYEYAPFGSDQNARTHPAPHRKKRARPDEDTRRLIANDLRPIKEVAEFWDVSMAYVSQLRAKHGTTNAPRSMVHPDVEYVILNSGKSIEYLSAQFGLPELIIKRIIDNAKENKTRI